MKEENAKVLNLNRRQLKTLIRILKTKTYVKNYRNLLKSNSFFFLRVTPVACGDSQARGPIRATAASLHHSNIRSEPCLQPTPQLTATPDL